MARVFDKFTAQQVLGYDSNVYSLRDEVTKKNQFANEGEFTMHKAA